MTSLGFLSSMARVAYFPIFRGLGGFVTFGTLGALLVCTHPASPNLQETQRNVETQTPHRAMVFISA